MAKKGQRTKIGLQCTVCKKTNYISERNKVNTPDKITLIKYCNRCKKRTPHKEAKKLD